MDFGMMSGFSSFDSTFDLFTKLFLVVFLVILGIIVAGLVRSGLQWHKNNQSPKLTVPAAVVAKRTEVNSYTTTAGQHAYTNSDTNYYVTFEVRSGDRMELCVSGQTYGMMSENDIGMLTFQGTRFLNFERR